MGHQEGNKVTNLYLLESNLAESSEKSRIDKLGN